MEGLPARRPDSTLPGTLGDPQLSRDIQAVRRLILDSVAETPPLIADSVQTVLGRGGKMLRPALVILGGRYGNFQEEQVFSLAAAVEMLHNATLVHDDILDEAEIRRGYPTLHVLHGNKLSLLLGDYLFSCCFSLAAKSTKIDHFKRFSNIVTRICEGEILQNGQRYRLDFSLREYKRRIARKTALLFALSLTLGARESGCPDTVCHRFSRIGYSLGMGFQIIDDILDYTATEENLGKPAGNDLRDGIYTAPIILSFPPFGDGSKNDDVTQRKELLSLLSNPPYEDGVARRVLLLTEKLGGMEQARCLAGFYTERARREIERLDPGYTRDQLSQLCFELLTRRC